MKRYKEYFREDCTLEEQEQGICELPEECPTPQQNGPSGYCKRVSDGAKLQGKCQSGYIWDDKTAKCILAPKNK